MEEVGGGQDGVCVFVCEEMSGVREEDWHIKIGIWEGAWNEIDRRFAGKAQGQVRVGWRSDANERRSHNGRMRQNMTKRSACSDPLRLRCTLVDGLARARARRIWRKTSFFAGMHTSTMQPKPVWQVLVAAPMGMLAPVCNSRDRNCPASVLSGMRFRAAAAAAAA